MNAIKAKSRIELFGEFLKPNFPKFALVYLMLAVVPVYENLRSIGFNVPSFVYYLFFYIPFKTMDKIDARFFHCDYLFGQFSGQTCSGVVDIAMIIIFLIYFYLLSSFVYFVFTKIKRLISKPK